MQCPFETDVLAVQFGCSVDATHVAIYGHGSIYHSN